MTPLLAVAPWVVLCLWLVATVGHAQEINFRDLTRSGPQVVKRYTVDGIAADGREYLSKFDGVDTSRVQARNATVRDRSDSSSGSSSQTSSKSNANGSQVFRCEFNCSTNNIVASNTRANGNAVDVTAASVGQAKDLALSHAKDYCWSNFKMTITSEWGSGNFRCTKR